MKTIAIRRHHNLAEEDCKAVAEDLLTQLVDHYGGSYCERGSDFQYEHPTGIRASVVAAEELIEVKVKLGMMTVYLAPKLEKEINLVLDEHLE